MAFTFMDTNLATADVLLLSLITGIALGYLRWSTNTTTGLVANATLLSVGCANRFATAASG